MKTGSNCNCVYFPGPQKDEKQPVAHGQVQCVTARLLVVQE